MTTSDDASDINEKLNETEVDTLRQRLTKESEDPIDIRMYGAVTVSDLAEATGLTIDQVQSHLRQIRAELAFNSTIEKKPFPTLLVCGIGLLIVAVAVIWALLLKQRSSSMTGFVPTMKSVNRGVEPKSLVVQSVRFYKGTVPNGIRIHVIGQSCYFMGDTMVGDVFATDYEWMRQRMAWAAAYIIMVTAHADSHFTGKPEGPYRDMAGNTVDIRPGQVHYCYDGWFGKLDGWVKVPLDQNGERQLLRDATKVLENAKRMQEDALRIDLKATEGIVLPPPGYSIEFVGIGDDIQQGPRISFAPIAPIQIEKRLELALKNALIRDQLPVLSQTSKKYTPMSRAIVTGPKGSLGFDIPTGAGWSVQAGKVIHRNTVILAKQIEVVNQRAKLEKYEQTERRK